MGRPIERLLVILHSVQILDQLIFYFLIPESPQSKEETWDKVYWYQLSFSVIFFLMIFVQVKLELSLRMHVFPTLIGGCLACIF